MRAKIARIQMDVDYQCPNCYLHFRLSNSKIPQRKQESYPCSECGELLVVPPVFAKANQTTSFTKSSPKNNLPIKNKETIKYIDRVNMEIIKLGLMGKTIVVSSGDTGAPDLNCNKKYPLNPIYPASSPWVTSVGATFIKGENKSNIKYNSFLKIIASSTI